MSDEAKPEKQATKRVDGASRPVHAERIMGRIEKQAGWVYQRCHLDDVDMALRPRWLPLSQAEFPGWEVVRGDVSFRSRADGEAKDTVATDRDCVWLRCREEHHKLLTREQAMRNDAAAARLRYEEREGDGMASFTGKIRDHAA